MLQNAPSTISKVLIRAVNWVGDAVMTTPAIGLIRQHFPEAEITLLANKLVGALFEHHDWIDRIIIFDNNGINKGIAGRVRLAGLLRKDNFDLAIILPNSFDSALVTWLAGIPVRVGRSSDGRGILLTGRYRPDALVNDLHEVEYYTLLVKNFGITGTIYPPYLTTTAAETSRAAKLLEQHGITAETFLLGINPGASFGSAKRWYPKSFAEVANRLAEKWNAKVLIFGGPGETDIAAEIEQQMNGNAVNLSGKTSVRELMALIQRCNFFITNDSGPMHIAAAFDVPLVAVFGPTDHTTTSPYTDKAVIVRKETDCSPCKLRKCPTDHRCMTAITPDDVVQAAVRCLSDLKINPTGTA